MKRLMRFELIMTLVLAVTLFLAMPVQSVYAQEEGKTTEKGFVDADGDGVNDNAPDADGDGIPNGQDPDLVKNKSNKGNGKKGFVDENGDGVNDNAPDADGDGIPNGKDPDFEGPKNKNGNQTTFGKQSKMKNKVHQKSKHKNRVNSKGFVDENGDGLNDNAKDADGDGIPNGQDPDFKGQKSGKGSAKMGFVDEDGDGINDNALDDDGDGIPNCKDEDYVKTETGNGSNSGRGNKNCNSGCQNSKSKGNRGGKN